MRERPLTCYNLRRAPASCYNLSDYNLSNFNQAPTKDHNECNGSLKQTKLLGIHWSPTDSFGPGVLDQIWLAEPRDSSGPF